jgi:hypothetical protein
MNIEVGYNIGKYLNKLKSLIAGIYITINVDESEMTEKIANIIAKSLP